MAAIGERSGSEGIGDGPAAIGMPATAYAVARAAIPSVAATDAASAGPWHATPAAAPAFPPAGKAGASAEDPGNGVAVTAGGRVVRLVDLSADLPILSPNGVSGPPSGANWRYVGQTYGMAVADIDGDGFLDLYVNHHFTRPSELISAFGSGTPLHTFIDTLGDQHGATFIDLDQDGDLDLFETRGGRNDSIIDPADPFFFNEVYMNVGGSLVVDNRADDLGIEYGPARSRIGVPINFDGKLGLFLAAEAKTDGSFPAKLVRMTQNGPFTDWGKLKGDLNGDRFAIGAHFGTDGSTDVLTAKKQFVTVHLNDGTGFSQAQNVVIDYSGFGNEPVRDVQIADFDGDLRQDFFVAIGTKNADEIYTIRKNGRLESLSDQAGISLDIYKSASATTGDFDNDGDRDIAVLHRKGGVVITFWLNDGTGAFTSERYHDRSVSGVGDKIVSGDFDNDGWIDFLVSTGRGAPANGDPDRLALGQYTWLASEGGTNNWLGIELDGVAAETTGLGARVYVTTPDGHRQVLEQDSGAHESVQDSTRLHFGLGLNDRASKVEIVWPSGHRQILNDIAANQAITITEERATLFVERVGATVTVTAEGSGSPLTAPGSITTTGFAFGGLTLSSIEASDLLTLSPGAIDFDLKVIGGFDAFSFDVNPAAVLDFRGDFDLVFI
jgi:hypothetical protein